VRAPRFSLVPVACAVMLAGALLYGLGAYPLLEPDEGRNAEVAREMATTNDYVLPRLNGLPYVDKPILYFAVGAAVIELLGPTETAARIPSLLFTLATAALIAWFAGVLYGVTGAWAAPIAYAASPFTIAYARTVIFDSALTLWITSALAAFYMAATVPGDPKSGTTVRPALPAWAWSTIAWAAMGLGVLTKGPVALAVPLLVVIPWAIWQGALRRVVDPVGLLAFVAVLLPWVLAMSRRVPDFLSYVLLVETAERLTTPNLGRTGPMWYFVPILFGAALPWTAFLLAGAEKPGARPHDRRTVFLLLWLAIPLLFFTLSQSKRPQYVLPLVPAMALLVATRWQDGTARRRGGRAAGIVLTALGVALVVTRTGLADLVPSSVEVAGTIPATALGLGVLCVASGVAAFTTARRSTLLLPALVLPVAAIPFMAMPLMRAIGADRSSAALAQTLNAAVTEQAEVVAIGVYPLSLAFYLGRPLVLATADGRELTSNHVPRQLERLRRVPGSPLRPAAWWEEALALCDRPRVFVVRQDDARARARLASSLPLIGQTRTVAAYGPCGLATLARGG